MCPHNTTCVLTHTATYSLDALEPSPALEIEPYSLYSLDALEPSPALEIEPHSLYSLDALEPSPALEIEPYSLSYIASMCDIASMP
jgi:hypothetical protein